MPWSFLICDHIAQMVVKNIDDLIIRYGIFVSTTYTRSVIAQSQESSIIKPTEDIRRADIVMEVTPQMPQFCTSPWALFDVFEMSAMYK